MEEIHYYFTNRYGKIGDFLRTKSIYLLNNLKHIDIEVK